MFPEYEKGLFRRVLHNERDVKPIPSTSSASLKQDIDTTFDRISTAPSEAIDDDEGLRGYTEGKSNKSRTCSFSTILICIVAVDPGELKTCSKYRGIMPLSL